MEPHVEFETQFGVNKPTVCNTNGANIRQQIRQINVEVVSAPMATNMKSVKDVLILYYYLRLFPFSSVITD